jgi:hypothetical protein
MHVEYSELEQLLLLQSCAILSYFHQRWAILPLFSTGQYILRFQAHIIALYLFNHLFFWVVVRKVNLLKVN